MTYLWNPRPNLKPFNLETLDLLELILEPTDVCLAKQTNTALHLHIVKYIVPHVDFDPRPLDLVCYNVLFNLRPLMFV